MSARTEPASLLARTRPIDAGAPIVAAHFLGSTVVFVLGEEALLFVPQAGEERGVAVHAGSILASESDGKRVFTAGDDGKVAVSDASGMVDIVATDAKRRWIDHIAIGPDGAIAWSAGKQVFVRTPRGETRELELPSSAGGLTFAPKGLRLAATHYNGVTLWFPNAQAAPELRAWKGSHLRVTFSPDGRFLITAMQEPMLHGWRLADGRDMRMSGYSAKVRSLSWSARGEWLASSGSDQIVLWPFQSKEGPMGKQPKLLAPYEKRAAVVACHPKQDVVAVGYEDGLVLLVRLDDAAEIVARRPHDAPVAALAWDSAGALLAFATEDGKAGVVTL